MLASHEQRYIQRRVAIRVERMINEKELFVFKTASTGDGERYHAKVESYDKTVDSLYEIADRVSGAFSIDRLLHDLMVEEMVFQTGR